MGRKERILENHISKIPPAAVFVKVAQFLCSNLYLLLLFFTIACRVTALHMSSSVLVASRQAPKFASRPLFVRTEPWRLDSSLAVCFVVYYTNSLVRYVLGVLFRKQICLLINNNFGLIETSFV